MPKGIAGRADAQSKVEGMEHGFAQNVMAGFSIEEVRRLVELWGESQEIANGPDPEWSARGFLERRYCVDRLRRLSTDLEAAECRVRTVLNLDPVACRGR
ncbi:hypothetical protein IVB14_23565 [Bradyrhizobium sp. 180]|uniref:hypothetical protein n=1 Tax=Bradyrhizobium sp. 180 TaxID=2782650 RepID=UPI001FF8A184|nr:hypothetical protein [Bradyrhizobium sp. 180]MCK1493316.1 hypothetical protein [Bradyrhizobium sp. 180]